MTYISFSFILFIAVFMVLFHILPHTRLKQVVILAGNLFFYTMADGLLQLIPMIILSVVIYFAAFCITGIYAPIDKETEGLSYREKTKIIQKYKIRARMVLVPALIAVIGILVMGKLLRFTGVGPDGIFSFLILPLGLSYYTLSSAGYLLDVFWRKTKAEKDFLLLVLCISYFPAIVEGPINKYSELMGCFRNLPGFSYPVFTRGLQRILWGFFKKLVIADRIALYTGPVLSDAGSYAGFELFFAVILCAVQLYTDFSGCMDIAIGVSEAIGVRMKENFEQPFFARSAGEFWRRWHISLGEWFREYIYMPLAVNPGVLKLSTGINKRLGGGKRAGQFSSALIPIMTVWVLTGLWHGTGVDYLVWGLYWGILILIETAFSRDFDAMYVKLNVDTGSWSFRLYLMIKTFIFFAIGRMLTVTGSLSGFIVLIKRMFIFNPWVLFDGSLYTHGLSQKGFYTLIFAIVIMWAVEIKKEKKKDFRGMIAAQPLVFRWICWYALLVFVLLFGVYGPGFQTSDFTYRGF